MSIISRRTYSFNSNRSISIKLCCFFVKSNSNGSSCSYTITCSNASNTNFSSSRTNNTIFINLRLNIETCRRIVWFNFTTRRRSISNTNLFIIHFKVSSISRIITDKVIIDTYVICTISILKTSQFMVREVRNKSICSIIFVADIIWISIQNSKLPKITTTSYTENSGPFNVCVFWIWNILWSYDCLTKVHTNDRRTTGNNNTTMNTIQFI